MTRAGPAERGARWRRSPNCQPPRKTNGSGSTRARAADADPDLFFHPEGERGSARRRRAEAAKQYCNRCPVLEMCRERSLSAREPFGVWGGFSEDERHAILAGRLKQAS